MNSGSSLQEFYEAYRHGSAYWASRADVFSAGLLGGEGPYIGFLGNEVMRHGGPKPMLLCAGSGSGKTRDVFGFDVNAMPGERTVAIDLRGDFSAISATARAAYGEPSFSVNPFLVNGLPCHAVNLIDFLDADDLRFFTEVMHIAESLIPPSGSKDGQHFESRARQFVEAFLKYLVEKYGRITLGHLQRLVAAIQSDIEAWTTTLGEMLKSRFDDVRIVAGDITSKQGTDDRELNSVFSTLFVNLKWLNDPVLMKAMENPRFSFRDLFAGSEVFHVSLTVPGKHAHDLRGFIQLFLNAVFTWKSRYPASPIVYILADETAQLGHCPGILRGMTFARGDNLKIRVVFQDLGQIKTLYGASALQTFLGNAAIRQFFGINDPETAQIISDMCGYQTLYYDDKAAQEAARWNAQRARDRMLADDESFASAYDWEHYDRASRHRSSQPRRLITPDEVLALPSDRQIVFNSFMRPILGHRYPYYSQAFMAGRYLPSPLHPPTDRVLITLGNGEQRWADVITEEVPDFLRSFPQFDHGSWSYVRGFKPTFNQRRETWTTRMRKLLTRL